MLPKAKVLTGEAAQFKRSGRKPGENPFPEEWFDGRVRFLERGVHFTSKSYKEDQSFIVKLRNISHNKGLHPKFETLRDGIKFVTTKATKEQITKWAAQKKAIADKLKKKNLEKKASKFKKNGK